MNRRAFLKTAVGTPLALHQLAAQLKGKVKITDVKCMIVRGTWDWNLVRVDTDAGVSGIGEAYWGYFDYQDAAFGCQCLFDIDVFVHAPPIGAENRRFAWRPASGRRAIQQTCLSVAARSHYEASREPSCLPVAERLLQSSSSCSRPIRKRWSSTGARRKSRR